LNIMSRLVLAGTRAI